MQQQPNLNPMGALNQFLEANYIMGSPQMRTQAHRNKIKTMPRSQQMMGSNYYQQMPANMQAQGGMNYG